MESQKASSVYALQEVASGTTNTNEIYETSAASQKTPSARLPQTELPTRKNLWKTLKLKIKAAQQAESTASSFITSSLTSADQRESSLRNIIDQFQTRRMEEVIPSADDVGKKDTNMRKSFSTTDKFTTDKMRVQASGSCLRYGVPFFDSIVVFGLGCQLILFPVLVSFQPTDSWMFSVQMLDEIVLIAYFSMNFWLVRRMKGLESKEISDLERHRREWLWLDLFSCLPINVVVGRDACFTSRYMCSAPMALNFVKLPLLTNRVRRLIYMRLESSNARKSFSILFRTLRIILVIVSIMNLVACLWYFVGTDDGWEHGHRDWFR
jgi:hypothetical protein